VEFKQLSGGQIMLTLPDLEIKNVEIIEWKVGPGYNQEVSKGLRFKMSMPMMNSRDLQSMLAIGTINSWMIRVTRKETFMNNVLGRMYMPLKTQKQKRAAFVGDVQVEEAFFEIYYAAASPSKRFERFNCPAFDHDKVIEKVDIRRSGGRAIPKLVSSPIVSIAEGGKVEEFGFRPALFNGGMSLAGEYNIEIALYDFEKKVRRSDFVAYPQTVIISAERSKQIKGCAKFNIPQRNESSGSEFQMKRR